MGARTRLWWSWTSTVCFYRLLSAALPSRLEPYVRWVLLLASFGCFTVGLNRRGRDSAPGAPHRAVSAPPYGQRTGGLRERNHKRRWRSAQAGLRPQSPA